MELATLAKLSLLFSVMLFVAACGAQPAAGQIATVTQVTPTLAFPPVDTQTAQTSTSEALSTQQFAPVSPTNAGNTAVVNASQLNLRVGPGLNYNIVKQLNQGVALVLLGKSSDGSWFDVQLQDGTSGWVFSAYVTTSANLANLPVMQGPNGIPTAVAPAAPGNIPLTGSIITPTPSSVAPLVAATTVPANSAPIIVAIANNQAQVTLSRYPAGKSVVATLGARGTTEAVRVAAVTIDANGSAAFNFFMPFSWPDGTPLTQQNLFMTASTTDGSFSRTLDFPFYSGR